MIDNICILNKLRKEQFEQIDLKWHQYKSEKEYRFNFSGKLVKDQTFRIHYYNNEYNDKVLIFKYFDDSQELVIYGSWNKFIKGNNIESITLMDVKLLKNKIEEVLKIDISECYLSSLEFGCCFEVNYQPQNYLKSFYDHVKTQWRTTMYDDYKTVSFGTRNNKITYYDKVEELKSKSSKFNYKQEYQKYRNDKIIRMEFKSSKPLFSIFNSLLEESSYRKIKVRDIVDESFWELMLKKLEEEYSNTLKSKVYNHRSRVYKPSEAKNILATVGYNKLTESGLLLPSISELDINNNKKDKQKYNNDRYRLNNLYNQYSTSELVKTETARVREFNEIFKNVISILRSTLVA